MKVGIITINDNNNYGNRLQNYAVQTFLKKQNVDSITIKNQTLTNNKKKVILGFCKYIYIRIFKTKRKNLRLKM